MVENKEDLKEKAKEKLKSELKSAKDKDFAEPVIEYLLKRCGEDVGVAEDVLLEHKNWTSCYNYIYAQARKKATGNSVAIRDDIVFEWAEDYYHKEDTEAEKKVAKAKKDKKAETIKEKKKTKKVPEVKEEKQKHKKVEELEGQMSIFDMGL